MEVEREIKQIGQGAYGSVYLIERNGKRFAKKKILTQKIDKDKFYKEANSLKSLEHQNIVKLIDFSNNEDYHNIVTEYCEEGDLQKLITVRKQNENYFQEAEIICMLEQIASALQYIHQKNYIHRDLKPANILLRKDKQIAIGDFGVARNVLNSVAQQYTNEGTIYYQSYQLLNGEQFAKKTDIWSLGVTLYQLCEFKFPFSPVPKNTSHIVTQQELALCIMHKSPPPRINENNYSDFLWNLILSMLQREEAKRPSASEILAEISKMKVIINSKQYIKKDKKVLGKGGYGFVELLQYSTALFALKTIEINSNNSNHTERQLNEVKILQELSHPNVLKYVEAEKKDDKLLIVTEYCQKGDLYGLIMERKSSKQLLSEDQVMKYFVQILSGLEYLHNRTNGDEKGIIHRDLKPSNIFIRDDDTLVIGDFGLAKVISQSGNQIQTTPIGTALFCAPEVLDGKPYSLKADVWSLGVLLYQLATLELPFKGQQNQNYNDTIYGVYKLLIDEIKKQNIIPVHRFGFSNQLNELIMYILKIDDAVRPTVKDVQSLPYVRKYSQSSRSDSPGRQLTNLQNQRQEQIIRPQPLIRTIDENKQYLRRKLRSSFSPIYVTATLKCNEGLSRASFQSYVEQKIQIDKPSVRQLIMLVFDLVVSEKQINGQ